MPYLSRDTDGKVLRVSTHSLPNGETVPHNHPDVIAFLKTNGKDPQQIEDAIAELRRSDSDMARAVEDVIMVLLKKNLIRMTDMPKQVQDRMSQRVKLRMMIEDVYDQASHSKPQ